jgi:hypothetical protein
MGRFCNGYTKFSNFCYYFYRIGVRFLLIRMPFFFIHLFFALLFNAYRKRRSGTLR